MIFTIETVDSINMAAGEFEAKYNVVMRIENPICSLSISGRLGLYINRLSVFEILLAVRWFSTC